MKDHTIKKRLMAAMMFLFLLLLSAAIIWTMAATDKKRSMKQARYVMISEISKLQYAIDSRLLSTEILEMIVVNNHGRVTDFDRIAERLYVNDPAIRSLQLAPDGVVSYVYPLEGNEEAFGDLFSDPDRRVEAEYARDTGKMTLAGPYELSQGGMGLVARNPIYIENSQKEEHFWGFSVAILNVPEIFNKAELENLSQQGYDYQIYRIAPGSQDVQIIVSNTDQPMAGAIEGTITVPNGTWFLNMEPKDGWISWQKILFAVLISLIINILLTLVTYGVLTISQQKRMMTQLANTDYLTGLYNSRSFMRMMRQFYDRSQPFGILYLDLNKFKAVNDEYGHDMGDKLLMEVAARIKKCLRREDFAFRIGGDEFTALIPGNFNEDFYRELTGKLEKSISQPYKLLDVVLNPSASCGFARYPDDERDLERLIQKADRKMYEMKRQEG